MYFLFRFELYTCPKTGKLKRRKKFLHKTEEFDFLTKAESYLSLAQKSGGIENVCFSLSMLAESHGKTQTNFIGTEIIFIDIDNANYNKIKQYSQIVADTFKVNMHEIGIIWSGHGLHYYIKNNIFTNDPEYFKNNRIYFRALVSRINKKIRDKGLDGFVDDQTFDGMRTGRLPGSLNVKPKEETAKVELINKTMSGYDIDLSRLADIPVIKSNEQVTEESLKNYPKPDSPGVEAECEFLIHCKQNPSEVSEPQWYALASIVGRLDDGVNKFIEYSKGHPDFDEQETRDKLAQSLETSGPRTCTNINSMFDCTKCQHYNQITSPILIKTDEYIETQEQGFRNIKISKEGVIVPGPVNYLDLKKHWVRAVGTYVSVENHALVHKWNGKYYEDVGDKEINQFVYKSVSNPPPKKYDVSEFKMLLTSTEFKNRDFFDSTQGKFNFNNGVYDTKNFSFSEGHKKEIGFRGVVSYDYDPSAECPVFKKFLDQITQGDESLQSLLLEFVGYGLFSSDYRHHKALFLIGTGSNGKSTFLDIVKQLAGGELKDKLYSAVALHDISDPTKAVQMEGKLLNISEETPDRNFADSSVFKDAVSGGEINGKWLYMQPHTFKNTAKFIFSANKLPKTYDQTEGAWRRIMVAPFKAHFKEQDMDKDLGSKLRKELSGIFNLVVYHYKNFKQRGYFEEGHVSQEAKEDWKEESDELLDFFHDCIHVDAANENLVTKKRVIYREFKVWCEEGGYRPINEGNFFKRLKDILPRDCKNGYPIDYTCINDRKRSIKHIGLKAQDQEF